MNIELKNRPSFVQFAFFVILFQLILFNVTLNAQQEEVLSGFTFPDVISPSPTVSALGEYLDHPVDYYTGIPQINVPLYEISTQGISIPIQLSYHASGIKVDQMASWVGIGWSLSCGGCISRTVRGGPDDHRFDDGTLCGYLDRGQLILDMYNGNFPVSDLELLRISASICGDAIPDMFNYQFGSINGSFMFDENGTVRLCQVFVI
ncbi:MAG: hypothetical protein PHF97_01610 [Bacteroidales bacterium]|nr:hypothetical protein [Bacteroidales bacterium]